MRFSSHLGVLMLAGALPFVLLAIGLSIWTAVDQRRSLITEVSMGAESLAEAIDRELRSITALLEVLATSPAVDAALAAGAGGEDIAAFHAQASRVAALPGDRISSILIMDREGRQIANTLRAPGEALPPPGSLRAPAGRGPNAPGLAPGEIVPHVVQSAQPFVSDLVVGPLTGRHQVRLVVPVLRDGAVEGVLIATILATEFGDVLRERMPAAGYVAALIDQAGLIAARTADETRFVGSEPTPEVRAFAKQDAIRAETRLATTADGVAVYSAFRKLDGAPWSLAYGAPRALVDAPIRRLLLFMGGAGSLALALFVAASFSIGRRLAREMDTLAGDARMIGRSEPVPDRVDRVREVADVRAALRAGVASLAAAEERMRLAVEGSGMATWDVDVSRNTVASAGHFLEMFGLPRDSSGPLPLKAWLDLVHPDDLPAIDAQWQASSREDARFHAVYRIRRADDGALRWLESFGVHIRDGGQHRFIGVTFDVTERHRAEEQRQLLMREVDHRAKNALAVVHSVVRLTRAKDPASYAAAVEGRVRALARAHDLLARDRWEGASLGEVAGQELAAQVANGQVTIGGPLVTLVAEAVQPVSMVLHELTTNATKYGALSQPEGHVSLAWRLGPGAEPLRLEWTERGGPPVSEPTSTGFGTRLIEATVRGQLGGEVRFDWDQDGLVCVITLPRARVSWGASARQAAGDALGEADDAPADLEGRRVLVVEDEAVIGTELALSLSRAGAGPVGPFATIGAAETALGDERAVDAAVLDVNLGGTDTLPLAQRLVAVGVPVVVVTGYSVLPTAWTDQAGIGAIIRKPVDPDELVAAVGRALRQKRAA